jgi:signal transduction histidine kinase
MTSLIQHLYNPSLDLVMLIIALIVDCILAVAVFRSNPKSTTNRVFALMTLCIICWLSITYLVRTPGLVYDSLTLHRLGFAFAAYLSFLLFLLAHTMPFERLQLTRFWFWFLALSTTGMALLNMSPYAIVDISIAQDGTSQPVAGLGLMPFSVLSTIFALAAVYILVRKYIHTRGDVKKQLGFVFLGMIVMLVLLIATLLVPIVFFGSAMFLPFTPLYVLAFLGLTAYAITKYHLFNIKVLVAQSLTIVIIVILFAKLFGEDSQHAQVVDLVVLLFMMFFGSLLVRSVSREVKQRERIEGLMKDLAHANERLKELDRQKTEFVSIASHQLRSPLTAIKGYASLLLEESFGKLPKGATEAVNRIFSSSKYMAASIEDFLNVSRIELGTVKYDLKEFDLAAMVKEVVEELRPAAEEKKLTLTFEGMCDGSCLIKGDVGKLRQVVLNLVDNAMKYTREGSISVRTSTDRLNRKARIQVKDTGVGIPPSVLPTLFGKFVRAKNANEVNVMGTGLGLYVAKQFVEAHGGIIWAQSEGQDKGSTFTAEFPLVGTETVA